MKHYLKIYSATLLLLSFLLLACKPEVREQKPKEEVSTVKKRHEKQYVVFEPVEKSVEKLGEVIFRNDTLTVMEEYTDAIAFRQQITSPDGSDGIMNYREKLIHLINKADTITLRKEMFKKELSDYDIMVLQSVSFDAALKNNIEVPLMLNFCRPDSDYCYFFSIKVENKQLKMEMIDEQEFRDKQD